MRTAPQLASRVKRARTTGGTCPTCRTTLIAGQQIGKVGKAWHHTACLAGRQPMIGPRSGA